MPLVFQLSVSATLRTPGHQSQKPVTISTVNTMPPMPLIRTPGLTGQQVVV